MKRLVIAMTGIVLTFAACGQEAPTPNANNEPANGHSHSGGHVLGQFKLDDGYFMQASHTGAIEGGGEVKFEIVFKQNDEPKPGANITVFAGSADGKAIGELVTAEWDEHAKLYKATLKLPAELPHGSRMYFEAAHDGKNFSKSVDVMGHDHS